MCGRVGHAMVNGSTLALIEPAIGNCGKRQQEEERRFRSPGKADERVWNHPMVKSFTTPRDLVSLVSGKCQLGVAMRLWSSTEFTRDSGRCSRKASTLSIQTRLRVRS